MTQEQIEQIEREVGLSAGDLAEHTESGVVGTVQWLLPSETAADLVVSSGGKFYSIVHRDNGRLVASGWRKLDRDIYGEPVRKF